MSRIGKKVIAVPKGVTVTVRERELEVKGPKGTLRTPIPEGHLLQARRRPAAGRARARTTTRRMHGLARALANNAIVGVTEGFTKKMDVVGVGYKADVQGQKIVFSLGYSHPIEFPLPEGVEAKGERVAQKASIPQYQLTLTLSEHRQAEARAGGRRDARPAQARPLQGQGRALRRRAAQAATGQDG